MNNPKQQNTDNMNKGQPSSSLKHLMRATDMIRLEILWGKSRAAEERGDLPRAIKIQNRIVSIEGQTYASALRLASLHYRNRNFDKALEGYQKAWGISDSRDWPLEGIRNCYQAMGDSAAAYRLTQKLQEQHQIAAVG